MIRKAGRELAVAAAIALLCGAMAFLAPAFFSPDNLRDLFLANLPVLLIALGMTTVVIAGQIDISVGSVFAVCCVVTGVLAKLGLPVEWAAVGGVAAGFLAGAINGLLTAVAGIPSIVVTLAAMIGWRDGLRWITQGAWVSELPTGFQWLGLSESGYRIAVAGCALILIWAGAYFLGSVSAGRAIYATGSNREAARLVGINTTLTTFGTFAMTGALTGLAAVVNSVRFNQIPSNAGLGLEMKVIAAVVVGGTAITGGTGSIVGTVLGVILLAAVGPALTFLGVSAYWERALQGAIILTAVVIELIRERIERSAARA